MMSALPQAPAQSGITAILAAAGGDRTSEPGAGFDQLFANLPGDQPIGAAPLVPDGSNLPLDIAAALGQPDEAAGPGVVPAAEVTKDAAPGEGLSASGAAAAAALLGALGNGFASTNAAARPATTDARSEVEVPKGEASDESSSPFLGAVPGWSPLLGAILPPAGKPATAHAAEPVSLLAGDASAKSIAPDTGASMAVILTQPAAAGAPAVGAAASSGPIAEQILDLASDDAWIAQLASDIAATKSESGAISFRLAPRHLGRLDVAMTSDEAGVSVKLDTQHEATATLVHAAQGRLVDELRQQGVRVVGAEVTCTPGETGRQSQGQGRAPAQDPAHLIETAAEHAEPRTEPHREDSGAARRGRFA